jgi:hypothetical protein
MPAIERSREGQERRGNCPLENIFVLSFLRRKF